MRFKKTMISIMILVLLLTTYLNIRYYEFVKFIGETCSFISSYKELGVVDEIPLKKGGLVVPEKYLSLNKKNKNDLCDSLSNSYQIIIPFLFFKDPQIGISSITDFGYSYIEIGVGGDVGEINGFPILILGKGKIFNIYESGLFSRISR